MGKKWAGAEIVAVFFLLFSLLRNIIPFNGIEIRPISTRFLQSIHTPKELYGMETFQTEQIVTELKRLVGEYGWGWSVVHRIINDRHGTDYDLQQLKRLYYYGK